jgi:hypothetical protein
MDPEARMSNIGTFVNPASPMIDRGSLVGVMLSVPE